MRGHLLHASLPLLGLLLWLAGCDPRAPDVENDTPEEAAETVGRLLCAEHRLRMEGILDAFDDAIAIQTSKEEILADTAQLRTATERLRALAQLFEDESDELLRCEVVLADIDVVAKDVKVHVALNMKVGDWEVGDDGMPAVTSRSYPVLLTLTHIRDAWRVTDSNMELALPRGALNSLLD